jgi:hypothetical protein
MEWNGILALYQLQQRFILRLRAAAGSGILTVEMARAFLSKADTVMMS